MMTRLWHLTWTEARAHRGALCVWLIALVWVATGSITRILIEKNLIWHEQLQMMGGTYLEHLLIWNSNNISSVDSWLWLGAGLLSAWIWLADPLQSPNAFWVTRPVRVRELMAARGLLCLGVFVVLPTAPAAAASFAGGFSWHDTFLSVISFWLVKAGLVPLGFLVGAFWPAPGRRWLALLPALAWWLALIIWRATRTGDGNSQGPSWTFTLLWVAVPFALLIFSRFRQRLIPQFALAILAFVVVWGAGFLNERPNKPARLSAEAAGFPGLRISGSPQSFNLMTDASGEQRLMLELKPTVRGLPGDIAAEITAWQLIATPGTTPPPPWPHWQYSYLLMDSFYGALASSMGLSADNFPAQWRNEERFIPVAIPASAFNAWKDDQEIKITGTVRLHLIRFQKEWQGVYHKSLSEWPGALRLHDAVVLISGHAEAQWLRPWLAQNIVAEDPTDRGVRFDSHRSFWFVPFQPPQRLPDGTFTKQITRSPALWAISEYEGIGTSFYQGTGWLHRSSSHASIKNPAPEFQELAKRRDGLDGLPAALVCASVFADLEVPFEPITLTKQQILATRKISPARP